MKPENEAKYEERGEDDGEERDKVTSSCPARSLDCPRSL